MKELSAKHTQELAVLEEAHNDIKRERTREVDGFVVVLQQRHCIEHVRDFHVQPLVALSLPISSSSQREAVPFWEALPFVFYSVYS